MVHKGVGVGDKEYNGAGFGKLLLFGEHAAVYGYPAVGLALPLRTTMNLVDEGLPVEPNKSAVPTGLSAPLLPESDQVIVQALWEDLFRIATSGTSEPDHGNSFLSSLRGRRFRMDVWSNVPRSRGLGSSAAACAALAGAWTALGAEMDLSSTHHAIWLLAHRLEHRFHGTPSGIDTGLAVHGGCRSFHFTGAELPDTDALPPPVFPIVAAAVPRRSDTKGLVADIRRRHEAGDRVVHDTLAQLGRISEQAIDAISAAAPAETLAAAANEADSLLVGLDLDSDPLRYGLQLAAEFGAIGGKISGAGGGGAFLAIFGHDQTEAAAAFAAALPARLQQQGGEAAAIVISPPHPAPPSTESATAR